MKKPLLPRPSVEEALHRLPTPLAKEAIEAAEKILRSIESSGWEAALSWARQLGDLDEDKEAVLRSEDLQSALSQVPGEDLELLERVRTRIARFAEMQLASLGPGVCSVPGGEAGHVFLPVSIAGCYAPGGRFPLPSSILMTVTTAKAAGVVNVWCASPRPSLITVAAAALSGADALLALGGAPAVGALAMGCGPVPKCDVVVGPGSKWVTAAKKVVFGHAGVDMLAGPSELLVFADESANPNWIAADLLAQAEHDSDAIPMLITTCPELLDEVERELEMQLTDLPTRSIALRALENGWAISIPSIEEGIRICNEVAPEHLELMVGEREAVAKQLTEYGSLFLGAASAEVFGDYGIGPNHVLPTGRTARFSSGLSVLSFLRTRTWVDVMDPDEELIRDCAALARLEGLEAHARAAEARRNVRQALTAD